MRRSILLVGTLAALVVAAPLAHAQVADSLRVPLNARLRVRLHTSDNSLVGRLAEAGRDSILLEVREKEQQYVSTQRYRISRADIARVDREVGRESKWSAGRRGAAVGAIVGAAMYGLLIALAEGQEPSLSIPFPAPIADNGDDDARTRRKAQVILVGGGTLLGTAIELGRRRPSWMEVSKEDIESTAP